eukprot:Protomagalhaensia_sp_Gyna_25__3397@NODE_3069_length_746_cov_3_326733_g2565_i0_p1_GENE_NODE_3069_length_746_cov_3_326733_g2565_i0NODE_3069_length_746_cov_3_326733_g2565_i0_p1_ORF_typecomplete_len144_score8_71_NODE_3069_length_746_cov_3_326733_g2565_i0176607
MEGTYEAMLSVHNPSAFPLQLELKDPMAFLVGYGSGGLDYSTIVGTPRLLTDFGRPIPARTTETITFICNPVTDKATAGMDVEDPESYLRQCQAEGTLLFDLSIQSAITYSMAGWSGEVVVRAFPFAVPCIQIAPGPVDRRTL